MSSRKHASGSTRNWTLLLLITVSSFGLAFSVLLAFSLPSLSEDLAWRKPVVGVVFSIVCAVGVVAVFFPNHCSKVFNAAKSGNRQQNGVSFSHASASSTSLQGHHPLCGRFSSHVFNLGGRAFCAACSGLLLGALIALVGTGGYFFVGLSMGQNAPLLIVAGVVGVALGLLQSPLPLLQNNGMRVFTSTFFVVGAFLILSGVEELAHDVSIDLFVTALSVLWIWTRIALSQWDHGRICSQCTSRSCSLKETWKGAEQRKSEVKASRMVDGLVDRGRLGL